MEGSVRQAGHQLHMTARLIDVHDGARLWSERYDRDSDSDDVFAVEDASVRAVVDRLGVPQRAEQQGPVIKRPAERLDAYNLCLQGRHSLIGLGPALEHGLACFTQALALDATSAEAHAGIAQVHALRAVLGCAAPHTVMPRAKAAALTALAIDETVADAHAALALVLDYYDWNRPAAEREYRRALQLNRGDTFARASYAHLLGKEGRSDVSVAEARYAVEHDPIAPVSHSSLVSALLYARRFDAAIAEARAGLARDPHCHLWSLGLGAGLAGLGRYDDAVEALRQATIVGPDDPVAQAHLGHVLGRAGRGHEALTILEDLERRRSHEYVSGVLLAEVHLGLGAYEHAITWLQRAAKERAGRLPNLHVWFWWDPLRADLRFHDLLRRMHFPVP